MPLRSLNEGMLFLDGKPLAKILESDISFENGEVPEYVTDLYSPLSSSAEISCECTVNADLFRKLAGVDLASDGDYTFIAGCPYQEQIRRHRKKRINKKWAKRYGYRTKFRNIELRDVTLVNRDDGMFDITGRCIHG